MPGKVKVKIIAGRNLPVMDRSSDTTDAYVEIKLGNTTYKTDVCRKSLNPRWNSEWYRFEVDDAELQDEPLQIRLMDYDMYSANDSIGKVYLDLNPLLLPGRVGDSLSAAVNNTSGVAAVNGSGSIMSGWIPVYDTMHGIRGEVNITVKVKLFNDFNKFKQSSCGVQFFCSSIIPHGFHGQVIHGFVEELVVNDDPEYHWIDKIRTPRASNEARQTLFFKLSGEVQRKIGLKALDMGANAVIGYCQCFDLEGESGIVARGIGTAVTLVRLHENVDSTDPATSKEETVGGSAGACLSIGTTARDALTHNHHRTESVGGKGSKHTSIPSMNRRSSDSDLSITPKGNSFPNSDRAIGATGGPYNTMIRSGLKQEKWEMLEYPFLTMSKYPPGFITHIGGTVSTRSVKLLERISNPDEPESRDNWWTELRMEIRSHARALACNVVLGYCENTSICDDVCILSASGTAAVIGLQYGGRSDLSSETPVFLVRIQETDKVKSSGDSPKTSSNCSKDEKSLTATANPDSSIQTCAICHIPYCESSVPFAVTMIKCAVCKHGNVPNILITTIEIPDEALTVGKGCLIQANVCRPKRDLRGEMNAKEISDGLPFLEFDLHRLVINKLKVKGMNAIFGLKVRVSIGERLLVGTATGTGVFLLPLPAPSFPKLVSGNSNTSDKKLSEMQKLLNDTINRNKEVYHLKNVQGDLEDHLNSLILTSKAEETEDEILKMDITSGNKDTSVLELDDTEDIELISVLMESCPPEGFYVVNTETIPGLEDLEVKNLQMFKQMSRVKLQSHQCPSGSGKQFHRLLQTVYFKLRRMVPCALCHLQFRVDIPEQDEIQLTILGTVLGFTKVQKVKTKRKITNSISKEIVKKSEDADEIFSLEEDDIQNNEINEANSQVSKSPLYSSSHLNYKNNANMRHGIDITALSYIPGAKIKQYLGNLNFFFIRESTSIREGCGLSGFVHSFGTEVLAIVRAHISALGGNAMVGYFMTECVLFHNPHKNQGQCLINVGGDVVFVSYFSESNHS